MSEPIDDKDFDEYLKGGSPVSQRYREIGADQVPPDLDRRVLAQARAAVVKQPAGKSRNWIRWSAPLALAASLVMVVTIVIESGVQNETVLTEQKPTADVGGVQNRAASHEKQISGMLRDESAPAAASSPSAVLIVPERELATQPALPVQSPSMVLEAPKVEEVTASAKRARQVVQDSPSPITVEAVEPDLAEPAAAAAPPPSTAIQQTTSVRPVPAVPPAAPQPQFQSRDAAHELSEVAVTGSRVRRAPVQTAGPRNTVPQTEARSDEAREFERSDSRKYYDPEKWLTVIRELRKNGMTAEADREWEQFVAAFPDHVVAEDDLARKKP